MAYDLDRPVYVARLPQQGVHSTWLNSAKPINGAEYTSRTCSNLRFTSKYPLWIGPSLQLCRSSDLQEFLASTCEQRQRSLYKYQPPQSQQFSKIQRCHIAPNDLAQSLKTSFNNRFLQETYFKKNFIHLLIKCRSTQCSNKTAVIKI